MKEHHIFGLVGLAIIAWFTSFAVIMLLTAHKCGDPTVIRTYDTTEQVNYYDSLPVWTKRKHDEQQQKKED